MKAPCIIRRSTEVGSAVVAAEAVRVRVQVADTVARATVPDAVAQDAVRTVRGAAKAGREVVLRAARNVVRSRLPQGVSRKPRLQRRLLPAIRRMHPGAARVIGDRAIESVVTAEAATANPVVLRKAVRAPRKLNTAEINCKLPNPTIREFVVSG